RAASKSSEETPLRRLAQMLVAACRRPHLLSLAPAGASGGAGPQPADGPGLAESLSLAAPSPGAGGGDGEPAVLCVVEDLLRNHQLHREPLFAGLKPSDPDAEAFLRASRLGGQGLDAGDQLWLNRHLLDAAFRQATGQACLRQLNSGLDGVL